MANQTKLSARTRTVSGSNDVKKIRDRGGVPAIIYGNAIEPTNLEVNRREIEMLLSRAAGESLLVDLEIDDAGKKTTRLSLIQEVQHHPLRGDVLHIDFQSVSATETIEAEIPIETVGEADGVKNFGGIMEVILRSLPIQCLPQNLPEVLEVDVSALKIGDSIHVRDLILPQGVEATMDGEVTVLSIAEPNVVEEPEPTAEVATAPEVLKEKKPEPEQAGESGEAS